MIGSRIGRTLRLPGWRKLMVGGLAAIGMVLATASPAHAATGWNRCSSGYLCLFTNADGGGTYASFRVGSADLRNAISGYVFDNKFSSGWNRSSIDLCAYAGYNYTYGGVNKTFLFLPGDKGNIGSPFNNNISSLKDCRA
jgi:hypothetical protein